MAKVLVVDDALFMRRMLSDILKKEGIEICGEAENGKDAIVCTDNADCKKGSPKNQDGHDCRNKGPVWLHLSI